MARDVAPRRLYLNHHEVSTIWMSADMSAEFDEWEVTTLADTAKVYDKMLQDWSLESGIFIDADLLATIRGLTAPTLVVIAGALPTGNQKTAESTQMTLGKVEVFGNTIALPQNKQMTGTMKFKLVSGSPVYATADRTPPLGTKHGLAVLPGNTDSNGRHPGSGGVTLLYQAASGGNPAIRPINDKLLVTVSVINPHDEEAEYKLIVGGTEQDQHTVAADTAETFVLEYDPTVAVTNNLAFRVDIHETGSGTPAVSPSPALIYWEAI